MIQETKREAIGEADILQLWGNKKPSWVLQSSQGFFGGMILMWDDDKLKDMFSGKGFVEICADIEGRVFFITNNYSSCSLEWKKMRDLLEELKRLNKNEEWCIRGDFNAILPRSDWSGLSNVMKISEMRAFFDFV